MADDRLKKALDDGRTDRAMNDRAITENRNISDDDRVAMFKQQLYQSALPDLPEIPGYHVCWLNSQNPRDSIIMRQRLGYELIKPEDVHGYQVDTIKTGDYVGCIAVNEMIAAKLPNHLYQTYMKISHHDEPMKEEGKLADTADQIRNQARSAGADVQLGDGIKGLRETVRAPLAF